MNNYPSYLSSYESGELEKIAELAFKMLKSCSICPRRCRVNRLKNELGFCKTGLNPKVFSYMPHYGEEPPISGECGSGTIFFSNCNMRCCYCQNAEFSQKGKGGGEVDFEGLANMMLELQGLGCHNINLVTPTHVMPQILKALAIAVPKGLKIPLVYNTSGYELASVIKLLDGVVDVYLADLRYADPQLALKYSQAPDYPLYSQEAVKEMHRQVGVVNLDNEGIIQRGLLIRHLVLPNNISGTAKIMQFIAQELSLDTYIGLMSQYFPCYNASSFKELNRCITAEEYEEAKTIMERLDLHNGWTQEDGGLMRFAGANIKPI